MFIFNIAAHCTDTTIARRSLGRGIKVPITLQKTPRLLHIPNFNTCVINYISGGCVPKAKLCEHFVGILLTEKPIFAIRQIEN